MLLRKVHTRRLSRLFAGLFAVQIVITGFCLLTSQAHAMSVSSMPMAQMGATHMSDTMMAADELSGHCSKSMQGHAQHSGTSHSGGCFHCDEPAQFVKAGSADLASPSLTLTCLTILPELQQESVSNTQLDVQISTGPPRSSSLLFTTTQRIRV